MGRRSGKTSAAGFRRSSARPGRIRGSCTIERMTVPGRVDAAALLLSLDPPAWFLRHFRCEAVPVCDAEADQLMEAARQTPVPAQRYALLAQAAARIDDAQLFIPITAPIRWSLISARIQGFAGNRYARHTLTDLQQLPGNQ